MRKFAISIGMAALPVLALAADFTSLDNALISVRNFLNNLIPVVIGIAVILFLVGLLQYVTAGGDEEKKAAARGTIIYGIIILFVMVAVWGFVKILTTTIFGGQIIDRPPYIPQAPLPGGR